MSINLEIVAVNMIYILCNISVVMVNHFYKNVCYIGI
jgi:hypothetical protein